MAYITQRKVTSKIPGISGSLIRFFHHVGVEYLLRKQAAINILLQGGVNKLDKIYQICGGLFVMGLQILFNTLLNLR